MSDGAVSGPTCPYRLLIVCDARENARAHLLQYGSLQAVKNSSGLAEISARAAHGPSWDFHREEIDEVPDARAPL